MDYAQAIQDFFNSLAPEVILLTGGIIALLMVYTYLKDDSSGKYKAMMALGFVFGVLMILMAISGYAGWQTFTAIVIVIMGFTMAVRPFRKVEFAVIIGLIAIAVAYILLANLSGISWLAFLSVGWPRLIVAFVAGALVYAIASFAEKIVMLFGKLFNWWPFLAILAIICISEALCILVTGRTIYSYLV